MKRLSVIIPMYNVESYVERCIRSLELQDIEPADYEIICINDGSPDKSRDVVISLQKEYHNITLIDQENQGVSHARNNGIDIAKGKYLLFVDPDDYVDNYSFKRVVEKADHFDAQVSFLGFTFLNEDGSIRSKSFNENKSDGFFSGLDAYYIARGDGKTDPDRMWAILFKREFIVNNNLYYLSEVPYLEDGELIARIMCLADRCIFDGHSFYQRTTRLGSATNSNLFLTEKATWGFLKSLQNLIIFRNISDLNVEQKIFLNQPIAKFVLLTIQSCQGYSSLRRLNTIIRKLKELISAELELSGCNKQYRFYGQAYNISPFLAYFLLIYYPKIKRVIGIR